MKKKTILEISLWIYVVLSAICLIAQFIPGIDKAFVFYSWLLCTNLFRLGLGIGMLYLMFKIIKLRKLQQQIRRWRA